MEKNLREIADLVGGEVHGDGETRIRRVRPIEMASEGDITFISNPKYVKLLEETRASAVIVSPTTPRGSKAQVRTENPYLAFARVQDLWHRGPAGKPLGILSDAIGGGVEIGKDPTVHPHVTVGDGSTIGDRVVLHPGVSVGPGCRIGDDVTIFPNVVIYDGVILGNRVRIHGGTVIGSDGFGYARDGTRHYKIVHAGGVVIEDDVEIGAGCTIDRAVSQGKATRIGRGTKLDNLIQIAHNVEIGEDCLLAAQVGISGSCRIEDRVMVGGQVGTVGHITIGEGSVVGAKAGVSKDLPPGSEVLGAPAAPLARKRREWAAVARLPDLVRRFREMERRLEALEKRWEASD